MAGVVRDGGELLGAGRELGLVVGHDCSVHGKCHCLVGEAIDALERCMVETLRPFALFALR